MYNTIPLEPVRLSPGCHGQGLPTDLVPQHPGTFTLELTPACNHGCVGCGNVFAHRGGHLSGAAWIDVIERIRPYATALRLSGGECTLHPEFELIVRACDDLGVPFVIFTNGHWRRPAEVLRVLSGCRNLGGLLISLHGHDAASYAAFVGHDTFAGVCSAITAASQANLRVVTNTILLTTTIGHLTPIIDLALGLGASAAAFSRYLGTPLPGMEPTPDQLRIALEQLTQLRAGDERILLNNCVPTCFHAGLPTRGCTSGLTHCTIDPKGNVRPCAHAPVILGSVLVKTMPDIWSSAALSDWHSLIPSGCRSCAAVAHCRGGCRATAFQRGVACDPLANTSAATLTSHSPRSISLYRSARPRLACQISESDGRCHLVGPSCRTVLTAQALPVLRDLDGCTTLDILGARYGQSALDLVGTLLEAGLVDLEVSGASVLHP
jgi:radical SAM protein with 4Fe4S-binding SPASM domain